MASTVVLTSHIVQVKRQMAANIPRALEAMGIRGVALVVKRMQDGYGKPIRKTGDLMRDVNFEVDKDTVTIGNSLEYAPFVHEGTRKMTGRPYLRDAILDGVSELKEVAEVELRNGMEES